MKFKKSQKNVAVTILCVYLMTSIHHVYGALLYETPWRYHIAYQGFTWLILSYLILVVSVRWERQFIKWIFVVFAGFFFVGAIGLYEGLYNHVLKNVLYYLNFDSDLLVAMYPPPKYELPNDFLFEVSGILTLVVSAWCLKTMIVYLKK
ncbi:MAG: hypothetical protein ABJG47_15075 [Ekhidna sp.]